ncbi:MAG: Cna domain protein [Edaphobacter sp.]|jgi:hypothetical protein|nr:Cna domain protein [Edaphobacter sp.]
MRRYLSFFSIFAISIILTSTQVFAAITGSISGRVLDSSNAVLPGVNVIALNEETGLSQTVTTDSEGFYIFSALSIGRYTVSVAKLGFKDYQATGIKVDANSSLRIEIHMVLGTVTETQEVRADALQVETQNTQLGQVIESEKITSVPLNGRAFTDLLALQPGVSPYKGTSEQGRTVSGDLNSGNQSVNGGREASNAYMINGADANEGVYNGAAIIPNLDSISEFRIITNNFDAEYGNFSGGQINVVTKSGTNQFHGDVFEFLRNTALDARNYYAPQRGVFIQNIFGGVIGGPIKKDKAFFFGDFQGTKQIKGATQNFQVPSAANRTGDLSGALSGDISNPDRLQNVQGAGWANTLSNRLGYAVTEGEPYYFSQCTSNTQCVFPNATIPKSAWSPAAVGMMQYIPQSNSTDKDGNPTYQTSAFSARLSDYKGAIRVDANTRYGNVFGYYFLDNFQVTDPYAGGINVPGFNSENKGRAQMTNLGLTTIFHNNGVNDFRFTYMRVVNQLGIPQGGLGVKLSSLGFVTPWGPTGGIDAINPAFEGVPNVGFNNFSFGTPADTLGQYNNTFQWLDSYTKVFGKHTLHVGVNYHYDQINERNYYGPNGQFSFGGQETGSDFADFLLGAPGGFIQASKQILDSRSHYFGAYAQDTFRVLTSLVLNYGIRYEVTTPWYDTQNKLEAIIPGVQSIVFPGAPKGYLVPGDPGVARTLAPIRWNKFAPRFGFAFAPKATDGFLAKLTGGPDMLSIRGGYGIFYTNIQDSTGFVEVGDVPYGLFYSSPVPSRLETPYIDRATGNNGGQRFPFTFPPTNVSPSNPDTTFNWASVLPISGALVLDVNSTIPYTQSYYFGLQRQFGGRTVFSLNYVGNVGRKLLTQEESNPGDPALCLELSNAAALAPGETRCGPGLESNVYTRANGQVVEGTRTTLGIDFGSNPYMRTSASSGYNSFQTSVQHNSKYAEFLLGYTFAKSIDNSSGQADNTNVFNPRLSRGLSNFDVTHNFVVSYTVQLPFNEFIGKSGWAEYITKGWAVSGITTLASGLPITMQENDDNSLTGTNADLPSYDPTKGKLSGNHNPRTGGTYFNTNLFDQEPLGQFGNSRRRFFHGPGINNTDLALLRKFQITERTYLQFRAEAFNVFNHAQFKNPSGNWNSSSFGIVTAANDPRIMQIALKIFF